MAPSNRVVGSSNLSGRTIIFWFENLSSVLAVWRFNSNSRRTTREFDDSAAQRRWRSPEGRPRGGERAARIISPGAQYFFGLRPFRRFLPFGGLIRTPDGKQGSSTTAPRSGDGDRPKGDPEGGSAQRE